MALPAILTLLSPIIGKIIEKIPNTEARERARLQAEIELQKAENALLTTLAELDKSQAAVNAEEAKHNNLFVAGWRPFIGWVGGVGFAWLVLLQPILIFMFTAAGHPLKELPAVDSNVIMGVVSGMLGLGGLRTFEKFKGVARS